jgi:hypothetical protein
MAVRLGYYSSVLAPGVYNRVMQKATNEFGKILADQEARRDNPPAGS